MSDSYSSVASKSVKFNLQKEGNILLTQYEAELEAAMEREIDLNEQEQNDNTIMQELTD